MEGVKRKIIIYNNKNRSKKEIIIKLGKQILSIDIICHKIMLNYYHDVNGAVTIR